jgi:Do/DeqQ family serine protease
MNHKHFIISVFLSSVLGGLVAIVGFQYIMPKREYESFEHIQNVRFSNYLKDSSFIVPEGLNFIYAAERVRPAVVHIKTSYEGASANTKDDDDLEDMFKDFHGSPFGGQFRSPSPRESAGSGVVISPDGYIATNNHVIEKADRIEIILNDKRSYEGKVVGTDPTTDLALVKIEGEDLPFVRYGDSDGLHIGEWVLAVGNPFDLTSTVTAGIVSAKGRNINILRDQNGMAVESFIQTDAAVNPGNSGGALVNLKGDLIGINTAIATATGISQGYSFAVPVTLVKKVMDDLLRYGTVQRALLGVQIDDITSELAREKGIKKIRGVYINRVNENSAAQQAGIEIGDIILKINEVEVNSSAELQGMVATFRPGDKITIFFERGGEQQSTIVTLRNSAGNTSITKRTEDKSMSVIGAELQAIGDREKRILGIKGGVKITKLGSGKIKNAGLKEGFIITQLNNKSVKSSEEVMKIIKNSRSAILVEGLYPDGTKGYGAIAP